MGNYIHPDTGQGIKGLISRAGMVSICPLLWQRDVKLKQTNKQTYIQILIKTDKSDIREHKIWHVDMISVMLCYDINITIYVICTIGAQWKYHDCSQVNALGVTCA